MADNHLVQHDASIAVVVTTIGRGEFLADYFSAASAEHVLDRTRFYIIPDRKTPPELMQRCAEYTARGMHITCPTLEEQETYLAKLNLKQFVPYNSDNRRNIGYLMALESGAPTIISIDDDNYCRRGENFFTEHSVVASDAIIANTVSSSDGWFNICRLMDVQPTMVYPRGFPYAKRHQTPEITQTQTTARVKLNAGLWLGEPDLDAMTWLVSPVKSMRMKSESVLLGENAWSPINTQNTSLHRDLIVSYYFAKMGYPLGNLGAIDRYGDILSGYLCSKIVRHMGDGIRVGTPLVDHRRNSHHYMRDATAEMGCVWLMEDLTAWLTDLKLTGRTYAESYLSLAAELDEAAERFNGFIWNEAARGYLHSLAYCMRTWTNACSRWIQS